MEKENITKWLRENISRYAPMEVQANWVATDLLRHLNVMERPLAIAAIKEYSQKLADEIEKMYPKYWKA